MFHPRVVFDSLRGQDAEMGEIVNLRRFKKLLAVATAEQTAKENRVRYGSTAAEKVNDHRKTERTQATLQGKRVARDPDGDER
jgi:hypothetical protein